MLIWSRWHPGPGIYVVDLPPPPRVVPVDVSVCPGCERCAGITDPVANELAHRAPEYGPERLP